MNGGNRLDVFRRLIHSDDVPNQFAAVQPATLVMPQSKQFPENDKQVFFAMKFRKF